MINIVLFSPEIPQNTGAIGRLCVSTESALHLIEPLGFSLDDKYLRRAGMDYWQHLDLQTYRDWTDFAGKNPNGRKFFISTKGAKSYWDEAFLPGDYLVFGRESAGLPEEFYLKYRENLLKIPMEGKFHRSLNLANAVSIVLYEALRQNKD